MSAAPEKAERIHSRHVLLLAAHGDPGPQSAGADVPNDGCGKPSPLRVRLSALGLRLAVDDLRPAVPLREGQAQHSRRHRGTPVQAEAAQREAERESDQVRQLRCGLICRPADVVSFKTLVAIMVQRAARLLLRRDTRLRNAWASHYRSLIALSSID